MLLARLLPALAVPVDPVLVAPVVLAALALVVPAEPLVHPQLPVRVLHIAPDAPVAVRSHASRFLAQASRDLVLAAAPVAVVVDPAVAVLAVAMLVRRSVNRGPSVGRRLRSSNQQG
jgi:hypothetical protein